MLKGEILLSRAPHSIPRGERRGPTDLERRVNTAALEPGPADERVAELGDERRVAPDRRRPRVERLRAESVSEALAAKGVNVSSQAIC